MCKKLLALFLSVIMLCSLSMVTSAETLANRGIEKPEFEEQEIQPMYDYTSNCSVTLSITNGTATCLTKLQGYSGTTTKIEITMTLQKKTLLWWSKVESWTTTVSGYYAALSKTASVGSGKYRVKAEFKVYSGSNSETITEYSVEKSV